MSFQRPDGRQPNQLRPISFDREFTKFASGSVLAKSGDTQVLCSVTIKPGVPRFLENTGQGWLQRNTECCLVLRRSDKSGNL